MPRISPLLKVGRLLDRLSDWLLQRLLAIDGYRIAAAFLFMLWAGTRLDANNIAFLAIQHQVHFLSAAWWEIIFMVCAIVMYRSPTPQNEARISMLFFILPVTGFFGLLILVAFLGHSPPPPYFLILLTLACVFIIDTFVARTRALNYCKRRIVEQEAAIVERDALVAELRGRLTEVSRNES